MASILRTSCLKERCGASSLEGWGPAPRLVCASWSLLRGRFAAPQDEGVGVKKLRESAVNLLKSLARVTSCAGFRAPNQRAAPSRSRSPWRNPFRRDEPNCTQIRPEPSLAVRTRGGSAPGRKRRERGSILDAHRGNLRLRSAE